MSRYLPVVLAVAFLFVGCGGGSETYELDKAEMKKIMFEMGKQDPRIRAALDSGNEELVNKVNEEVEKQVNAMTLEVVMNDDNTFTLTGKMGDEDINSKGEWTQNGEKIEFKMLEENGKAIENPKIATGTLKDGVLKVQPPEAPFEVTLNKK